MTEQVLAEVDLRRLGDQIDHFFFTVSPTGMLAIASAIVYCSASGNDDLTANGEIVDVGGPVQTGGGGGGGGGGSCYIDVTFGNAE